MTWTASAGATQPHRADYGIGLSPTGVRKLLPQLAHNIVFVAACFSWEIRDAFVTTAIEYFGYTQACTRQGNIQRDTTLLYRRLAGREFDGKAREVGSGTAIFPNLPDGSCTAFGKGGYSRILRHDGPGNTTVAPIVAWVGVADSCRNGRQAFDPKDQTFVVPDEGLQTDGSVTFDTAMDTSSDPTKVLTTGLVNDCNAVLTQVRWVSDKQISFKVVLRQAGTFDLVVHNELAISANNKRELDGNQRPMPFKTNGVGRNRDDYVARNDCVRTPTTTTSSTTTTTDPDHHHHHDHDHDRIDHHRDRGLTFIAGGVSAA